MFVKDGGEQQHIYEKHRERIIKSKGSFASQQHICSYSLPDQQNEHVAHGVESTGGKVEDLLLFTCTVFSCYGMSDVLSIC